MAELDLPIYALSVRQPWAWAIIHAGKRLENRSGMAITRGGMRPGRICIHASKGMTRDEYEDAADTIAMITAGKNIIVPRPDELIRGGIIGTVTVTGKVKESTDPWFFGPWALTLESPEALAAPIPVAGELGYFDWRKNTGADWSSKAVDDPLPWMRAWPNEAPRAPRPPNKAERARAEKQAAYEAAMKTKDGEAQP